MTDNNTYDPTGVKQILRDAFGKEFFGSDIYMFNLVSARNSHGLELDISLEIAGNEHIKIHNADPLEKTSIPYVLPAGIYTGSHVEFTVSDTDNFTIQSLPNSATEAARVVTIKDGVLQNPSLISYKTYSGDIRLRRAEKAMGDVLNALYDPESQSHLCTSEDTARMAGLIKNASKFLAERYQPVGA